MKIYVYDMVDFEEETLMQLSKASDDEIIVSRDHLTIQTLERAKGCQGVSVLGYSKVTREVLKKMKEYGIIGVSTRTIGYDHFDVQAAKEYGIKLYHAHYDPYNVAEFTVMMMLVVLRKVKISICRALVNDFSLDGMKGRELRSLTVGVIGTGKIGSAVIENLSGFGCKILAYSRHPSEKLEKMVSYVSLDTLYAESDIISLHVPLSDENYHMINYQTMKTMKRGAIIINTARGALIDTKSLIQALEEEQIGGAAVDTLEEEQDVIHTDVGTKIINKQPLLYLKQFPNVVYTQHYAFYTQEAVDSMIRCGVESLQYGINGVETLCEITK